MPPRIIAKKLMPPRIMTTMPTNPPINDESKREHSYKIEVKSLNFNLVLQYTDAQKFAMGGSSRPTRDTQV
jgi:hypothetical protein